MKDVVAVLDRADAAHPVVDVAASYAHTLGAHLDVVVVRRAGSAPQTDLAGDLPALAEVAADDVVASVARADLVVVPVTGLRRGAWGRGLLRSCEVPVLAVPDDPALRSSEPERVLVPLDGSEASRSAVTEATELFGPHGAETVVVHVFDRETAPPFWDHAEHAHGAWGREFLTRQAQPPGSRVVLRSGPPPDEVLAAARAEHADLVVLGCAGNLSSGRARVVRHVLEHSEVPVLVVHAPHDGQRPGARP